MPHFRTWTRDYFDTHVEEKDTFVFSNTEESTPEAEFDNFVGFYQITDTSSLNEIEELLGDDLKVVLDEYGDSGGPELELSIDQVMDWIV